MCPVSRTRRCPTYALFLALSGFALLAGGCASYEPLDVAVINLKPLPGSLLEQRIRVDLRIQNPSDETLYVTGMQFKLDVNGRRLARGVSDASYPIPRLSEVTTSVVASTTLFDWLRQLTGLETGQSLSYRLSGKVYLKNGLRRSLPFRRRGEIDLSPKRRTPDQ